MFDGVWVFVRSTSVETPLWKHLCGSTSVETPMWEHVEAPLWKQLCGNTLVETPLWKRPLWKHPCGSSVGSIPIAWPGCPCTFIGGCSATTST